MDIAVQCAKTPIPLRRVPSSSSVLEVDQFSDCESPTAANHDILSPRRDARPTPAAAHALPPAPTLLESTLSAVAAAVLSRTSLPQHVRNLLRLLFPSAVAVLASVPAADGLSLAVVKLLPPAARRQPAGEELAAPLPHGGMLSFCLARTAGGAPPEGELALMEAFASALATRLEQHTALGFPKPRVQGAPLPPAPVPDSTAPLPADCFWESV